MPYPYGPGDSGVGAAQGSPPAPPGRMPAPAPSGPTPLQSNVNVSGFFPQGYNPLQPSYVDPTAAIQQLLTAFAPQAYNAQSNLSNQMAQYGIEGGPALALTQALQGQLTSSLAPEIGNMLSQSNFFNAGAANQAGQMLGQDQLSQFWQTLQSFLSPYQTSQGVGGQMAANAAGTFGVPQSGGLNSLMQILPFLLSMGGGGGVGTVLSGAQAGMGL